MELGMVTIFAAIGNSDGKLTQRQWSEFVNSFVDTIRKHASKIHGEWFSASTSPFQNACVSFEVTRGDEPALRSLVSELRANYRQDSVAWSVVDRTHFI